MPRVRAERRSRTSRAASTYPSVASSDAETVVWQPMQLVEAQACLFGELPLIEQTFYAIEGYGTVASRMRLSRDLALPYAAVDACLRSFVASADRAFDELCLVPGIDPELASMPKSAWPDDSSDLDQPGPSMLFDALNLPPPLSPPVPDASGKLGDDVMEDLVMSLGASALEIGTMRRSVDPAGLHGLGVYLDLVSERIIYYIEQEGHHYRIDLLLRELASVTQEIFGSSSILHIELSASATLEYRWRPCVAMPFTIQRDFTENEQCAE